MPNKLKNQAVIQPSNSEWCSLLVLQAGRVFSKIDCRNGYYKVELEKSDSQKTASEDRRPNSEDRFSVREPAPGIDSPSHQPSVPCIGENIFLSFEGSVSQRRKFANLQLMRPGKSGSVRKAGLCVWTVPNGAMKRVTADRRPVTLTDAISPKQSLNLFPFK